MGHSQAEQLLIGVGILSSKEKTGERFGNNLSKKNACRMWPARIDHQEDLSSYGRRDVG